MLQVLTVLAMLSGYDNYAAVVLPKTTTAPCPGGASISATFANGQKLTGVVLGSALVWAPGGIAWTHGVPRNDSSPLGQWYA